MRQICWGFAAVTILLFTLFIIGGVECCGIFLRVETGIRIIAFIVLLILAAFAWLLRNRKNQKEPTMWTTATDLIEQISEFRSDKAKVEHIQATLTRYKLGITEDEVVKILSMLRNDKLKIDTLRLLRPFIEDVSSKATTEILKSIRDQRYKSQVEKVLKS